MADPQKRKKLVYDEMAKRYSMPSYEEFDSLLEKNPDLVKNAYDVMAKDYDVKSPEDFSKWLFPDRKPADSVKPVREEEAVS